jgi:Pyruvate/2-oxoacid:ferredoxin oxidoreductase delta subunit
MAQSSKKRKLGVWQVSFDTGLCSLCEICVRRCPVSALEIRRDGLHEQIWFTQDRCNGCDGEPVCAGACPEKAVAVRRAGVRAARRGPAQLVSGDMARCEQCGTEFAPQRKLDSLLRKGKISPKDVHDLCPPCRRSRLLDVCISGGQPR